MAQCDTALADRCLQSGANDILARLAKRLDVTGADHIPTAGPLLIAGNHSGLSDARAIFATPD
jgi:1-acyl-sn-glycerol-3-phosphate acyltransferase